MAEKSAEILGAFKELKGILKSLESANDWFHDHGFTEHANHVIERIGSICREITDINSYKLMPDTFAVNDNRRIVHTTQARQKINSLIGRMEGEYGLEEESISHNGHTFIQNQSQSQSLSVALDLQERILTELPKHEKGTKERGFLEKMKASLPTIKNAMDVVSIALRLGTEMGLDPETIRKLLNLH